MRSTWSYTSHHGVGAGFVHNHTHVAAYGAAIYVMRWGCECDVARRVAKVLEVNSYVAHGARRCERCGVRQGKQTRKTCVSRQVFNLCQFAGVSVYLIESRHPFAFAARILLIGCGPVEAAGCIVKRH